VREKEKQATHGYVVLTTRATRPETNVKPMAAINQSSLSNTMLNKCAVLGESKVANECKNKKTQIDAVVATP
jgi:hypothetical protein